MLDTGLKRSEVCCVRDKVLGMDLDASQHEHGFDGVSISLAPVVGAEADHLLVLDDIVDEMKAPRKTASPARRLSLLTR